MKCLTICQPYAHLIVTPQAELPKGHTQKLVENRTWITSYRGPLLIHAGKSRNWLEQYPGCGLWDMPFGAIVGVALVVDCVPATPTFDHRRLRNGLVAPAWAKRQFPWLARHPHVEGPRCLVLAASDGRPTALKFKQPIPYSGQQGMFEVPDDVVSEQLHACAGNATRAYFGEG
jgi:hypothetical protein